MVPTRILKRGSILLFSGGYPMGMTSGESPFQEQVHLLWIIKSSRVKNGQGLSLFPLDRKIFAYCLGLFNRVM